MFHQDGVSGRCEILRKRFSAAFVRLLMGYTVGAGGTEARRARRPGARRQQNVQEPRQVRGYSKDLGRVLDQFGKDALASARSFERILELSV
jgi:hypothetical protein